MLWTDLHSSPQDYNRFAAAVNMDSNPVKYLAIDPGKSNGVCGFDKKFYTLFMYTVPAVAMNDFLDCFAELDICITESFTLYPNKAQQQVYSDMETSRVIGRIEGWTARNRIELVMQPATIKKTGYAWVGMKQPSKSDKANHEKDAYVHGMYYGVRKGLVNAADLLRRPNQHAQKSLQEPEN